MQPTDFNDFQLKQFTQVLNLIGEPITYQGLTFNAVVSSIELYSELVDGGLMDTLASQVIFLLTSVPTVPKTGDKLLIGTKEVRVKRVVSDAVSYELICMAS